MPDDPCPDAPHAIARAADPAAEVCTHARLLGALYAARDRSPVGSPAYVALDAAALRVGRCPCPEQLDNDWLDPVRRAAIWWAPTDLDLREWIGKTLTPHVQRTTERV